MNYRNKHMTRPRSRFYKGLTGFTAGTEEEIYERADNSIYRWWWEFMRLSPIFWYAGKTGHQPIKDSMAKTYQSAGNLKLISFTGWWDQFGKYIFEEPQRPRPARKVDIEQLHQHKLYKKSILVEIPLTATNKKIHSDIKKILKAEGHNLTALSVVQASESMLKLHSKKYHSAAIENEYWVLLYRILYPKTPLWKIGDRLQINPTNRVRGLNPREVSDEYYRGRGPIAKMQSVVGRCYYKARFARYHAEHGSFPNYTKVDEELDFKPFGAVIHPDFLAATDESTAKDSAWQKHIRRLYEEKLHDQILHKNNITGLLVTELKASGRLKQFTSGEIDSIN